MNTIVPFEPPTDTTPIARRMWCGILAKLVSPTFPQEATTALADMLPALGNMPEYLFTADTARHVALVERRLPIPNFKEIVGALNDYRHTFIHEPERFAIAAPTVGARTPPTPEELRHVTEALTRHRAELNEARIARETAEALAKPHLKPLPDVTLKGEALRLHREARGVRPKVPA